MGSHPFGLVQCMNDINQTRFSTVTAGCIPDRVPESRQQRNSCTPCTTDKAAALQVNKRHHGTVSTSASKCKHCQNEPELDTTSDMTDQRLVQASTD